MMGIIKKRKKVISFILVFLMSINNFTFLGFHVDASETNSDVTGQLLKADQPLTSNASVSVNDILTWRVSVDKNELEDGITITLPSGVLPDISVGGLEGFDATVNGNSVTVASKRNPDVTVTGSAINSASVTSTTDTEILNIPCKIEQGKVSNGKISIAGIELNVTDGIQTGSTVAPNTIELLKKSGSVETTITTGATISMNDSFILRMNWKSLEGVKAGDFYELELPEEFGVPSADGYANIKAESVPAGFPDLPFATISWKAGDKTLHIEFLDMGKYTVEGVEYDALSLLGDASIDYECKLDENLVANDQGKITIDLLSDSVTVTVSELVPKAPRLDKVVGTWNEQGEVEWTVTYTHPVSAYTGDIPTKLTDTIPDGMVYVENSSNVVVNGVDKTSWVSIEDEKLTCDLTHILGGQTLTFKYKTKLTEGELNKIWVGSSSNRSYTNNIVAKVDNTVAKGVEGKNTATISSNSWSGSTMINKDGKAIAPTGGESDWKINWEVTVKTASRNFKNLTLIDTMGEGLILDEDSVKVVNENGVTSSVTKSTTTDADGKTQMTIKLVEGGVPATAEATYKITYTTTVKQEYFDQTSNLNGDSIINSARLLYEWAGGVGIGGTFEPPTVSKNPSNINNTLIAKFGKSYNKTDHSLLWEIKVNPNKVNLTKVELVDDLTNIIPEHTFVPDESTDATIINGMKDTITAAVKKGMNDAGISSAVQDTVEVELVGEKLTIKMSNLGKNSFAFQLKTYASDPSFYAGNANATFKNKVTMTKAGTTVDSTRISADVSASATISASSTVLTKEHVSYDPVNKKLTWRLTVNTNETNLGDVTISDKLADGLSCNVDEATLNGGSFTGGNEFLLDNATNTITINLENVTKKQTITFTTKVDVDNEAFYTKDKVDFSNTATMTSQTNTKDVESVTSLILSNKALSKTAVKNDQNLTADYTVKLNPLGMDLLNGLPSSQKLQLQDTLPDGLYLDLDSVKLYKAGASDATKSSNTYTVELTPVGAPINTTIDYDTASRTLTVDIPDATQGYILTYKTYIVRTGVDLKNDIRLVGSILPDTSSIRNTSNTMKVASNGNAKMVLPKASFVALQIKKVDENGNSLNGAVFGLYAKKTDATPLVSATCDSATGICTLAIQKSLVNGSQILYWKEITAPIGYELSSEWHELDVANYNPDTVINFVNVPTGDATSGQIKMKKIDLTNSKVLSGAVFKLYEDKDCTTPVMEDNKDVTSTSDSNGIITFSSLYPERTYYVKEVSAPTGYICSEQTYKVAAKKTWVDTNIISITNEKADVTLKVVKVDAVDATKSLSDAEFELYEDENCTIKVGDTRTSIADGTLSFTGLYPEHTYYLKEITAPEGYILTSDIFMITTGNNGEVLSKQIGNYRIGWNEKASIQITKTNEDGSKLLSKASFALYGLDKTTLLGQQSTDGNGVCSFTGLKQGTYYIKEIAAPEGYLLSKDYVEVIVGVNEVVSLSITNKVIPPTVPVIPTNPTNPTNPTEPTKPTDPTNPTEPSNPTDPKDPTKPTDPSDKPEKPTKPSKPQVPDKPDGTKSDDGKSTNNDKKNSSGSGDKGTNNRNGDHNTVDKQKVSNDALPKTGVKTHFVLWITGFAISSLAAIGLMIFWRYRNKRINSK